MELESFPPRDNDTTPPTPPGAIWPAITGKRASRPVKPVISIITPVKRGGGRWLAQCWDSLLDQDETRWEWLIELDGNGEMEVDLKQLIERADSRLKIASCGLQMFAAACRNMALSRAQSEWILPLDADDQLPPKALSTLLQAVTASGAKACVGTIEIMHPDGTRSQEHHKFAHGHRKLGESYKMALELQQMPHLSVGTLMETRLLTMLGGYPATPYAQDLLVQYLISGFGDIVAIPETTYIYRRHTEQMTNEVNDSSWRLAQWRSRTMLSRMVVAHDPTAELPDYPVF